jgi:hypothetical protein
MMKAGFVTTTHLKILMDVLRALRFHWRPDAEGQVDSCKKVPTMRWAAGTTTPPDDVDFETAKAFCEHCRCEDAWSVAELSPKEKSCVMDEAETGSVTTR